MVKSPRDRLPQGKAKGLEYPELATFPAALDGSSSIAVTKTSERCPPGPTVAPPKIGSVLSGVPEEDAGQAIRIAGHA